MRLILVLLPLIMSARIITEVTPQMPEQVLGLSSIEVKFSHGKYFLLPSLIKKSFPQMDSDNIYSDLWISGLINISPTLRYTYSLELTNLPHEVIGTNYSRQDFLLTTGRVQESKVAYTSELIIFELGRANFIDDANAPRMTPPHINGDGFAWRYRQGKWSFKNAVVTLPSEISENRIFRRLLNYHHLSYVTGAVIIGAGEYFIVTGDGLTIDLKRFNPFIPYSLNSHDSRSEVYPGFSGDSDNSIINFFFKWQSSSTHFWMNLYVDEFQIDPWDRKLYNHALLLNTRFRKYSSELFGLRLPWSIEGVISVSNPNFGEHPGPFTTMTSASVPLFEYSPGMVNLWYLETEVMINSRNKLAISGHQEHWVDIGSIETKFRDNKSLLKELDVKTDFSIGTRYSYNNDKMRTSLILQRWWQVDEEIKNRYLVKLEFMFNI
jgi:hypothetical protein